MVGDFNRYGDDPASGISWGSRLTNVDTVASEQEGRDSGAYRILTGAESPVAVAAEFRAKFEFPPGSHPHFKFIDLRAATPRINVTGFFRTFTGFNQPLGWGGGGRIDYILGSSAGGW